MRFSGRQRRCADCPVHHRAFCARCEAPELARLEEVKYYRSFDAGQPVVWAGDQLDFVASVVTGVATLTQTILDGRTQMVGLLLPSDFIGRPGHSVAHYNVTAATNLTLCCFRRRQFEKLIDDVPHIGKRLLEMALNELDAARDWMLILGRKTAREKTATLLLVMAQRLASQQQSTICDGTRFDLPLTRDAMANFLGLSLETVSREISSLKHDQFIGIENNRSIIIPDISALKLEAGDGGFLG